MFLPKKRKSGHSIHLCLLLIIYPFTYEIEKGREKWGMEGTTQDTWKEKLRPTFPLLICLVGMTHSRGSYWVWNAPDSTSQNSLWISATSLKWTRKAAFHRPSLGGLLAQNLRLITWVWDCVSFQYSMQIPPISQFFFVGWTFPFF